MPSLTPEARARLAAYLRFQKGLGAEQVRIGLPLATANPLRVPAASAAVPAAIPPAPGSRVAGSELLPEIQADLGPDCQRCKLHRCGRQHIVFGDGDPEAELIFVGEGPGADEDKQGLPFVGRAGQLLNDMIQKGMGLRREQVYICNVVKCRPPGNRTPEADEIAACVPFLWRQLAAIRPRIVCALGATAAQALHPYKGSLASVRGTVHALRIETPQGGYDSHLVVTYHPAYLLRDPSQKKEAWKDLQLVMEFLGLSRPPRS